MDPRMPDAQPSSPKPASTPSTDDRQSSQPLILAVEPCAGHALSMWLPERSGTQGQQASCLACRLSVVSLSKHKWSLTSAAWVV